MADLSTAIDFLQDVNLNGRELLNVKLDSQSIARVESMIWYKSDTHRPTYQGASQAFEIASLTGTETLTNKTIDAGLFTTSIGGNAFKKYSDGIAANVLAASETLSVTEKYVIGAVVAGITANNARVLKGEIDCSTNPNYPAGSVGEEWVVSVAGKIGGASGAVVEVGDSIICKTNSVAGDQATVGNNWFIVQSNINILPVAKGGTNITAYTAGDLIYATGTTVLAKLAKGNDNDVLTISPTTHLPVWSPTQSPIDTFLELTDTPSSYASQATKLVRVNAGATALEFYTLPTYDNYQNWKINAVDAVAGAINISSLGYAAIIGDGTAITTSVAAGTNVAAKVTVSHSTSNGYKHIPADGATGRYLKWASAGTAQWDAFGALSVPSASSGLKIGGSTTGTYSPTDPTGIEIDWAQVASVSSLHTRKHNITSTDDHEITEAVVTGYVLTVTNGTNKTFGWAAPAAVAHPLNDTNNTVLGLTAGKILRATGATTYGWSTATFADTYTTSNLLYSNGANNVVGLATANSGILVTSGTGVPSIGTDIPTAVTIGGSYIYRAGGTDVAVADGGTNISSYTIGDMLYASGATTLSKLAKSTNASKQFLSSSSSTNPTWASLTVSDIPSGIGRFAVLSYDSTKNGSGTTTTTQTYAKAEHNCGDTPLVLFLSYESATELKYKPVVYKVEMVAGVPNGNVTIYTPVASKGRLLFVGN